MAIAMSAASCGDDPTENAAALPPGGGGGGGQDYNEDKQEGENMTSKIMITVGGTEFSATLADNATAKAFAARLPMTLAMNELNGNEKYYNLDEGLPSAAVNPGTIHAGDIMLWGDDCVVLFYDTFATPYSYTRIGRVDNPSGLAGALGSGRVSVEFSVVE